MEKISVIIPVYNVEKYVNRCIESILNQTYKELELIIIDDKSTDKSISKINKYRKKVKILQNSENKGLSYTRNIGLTVATGNYISFIDSDDFIPNNFYEELVASINKTKSQIAVCDINCISKNGEELRRCGGNSKDDIINNPFAASSCNKLFKKDIFKNVRFTEGKINEDVGIIIPLLEEYKVSYTNKTYYNYYQRNDSIQNQEFSEKRFDIFDEVEIALSKMNNQIYKDNLVFNQIILLYIFKIINIKNFFIRYKWLKKYHKKTLNLKYYKNNEKFKDFLKEKPNLIRFYYRVLFDLNNFNLIFLENILISGYNAYKKTRKVTKDICLNDLIKCAINQSKMNEEIIKVSVVVPNYNYERYLYERIYSILNQNYKINELIILDDCSTDNSINMIEELKIKLKKYIKIKVILNSKNSGSVFKQWQKGFEMATGDYVWIAEADDYCDRNFLKLLTKGLNKDIIISYSNTSYINAEGYKRLKSIFKVIDNDKTNHWNNSYISSGKIEFKKYMYLSNTIPNVSSCIIKKDNYFKAFSEASKFKQAGDWIFYAIIIQNGKIKYTKNVNNYYRQHGNNISTTFEKTKHLEEIKKVHNYFAKNYTLSSEQKIKIVNRYKYLKNQWGLNEEDL